MANKPVFINTTASISVLGPNAIEIWKNLKSSKPNFTATWINEKPVMVCALNEEQNNNIETLRNESKLLYNLDKTTLLAIAAGRELAESFQPDTSHLGINIGSSRGATHSFEEAHKQFVQQGDVPFMTSPTTTLGNVASSVAQDLGLKGPAISHSITCSSALHALLNASAFLQSGMLDHFIIGGTEAPITDFTIAQMQALKLYSPLTEDFPCRSLDFSKSQNTLVLGEAACLALLSTTSSKDAIEVAGVGYATEQINHSVALSSDARCLQKSMQMALHQSAMQTVDAIVMHAPGTVKGDQSELKAIENTFEQIPALTTNKFLIGHTFGASGAMSLEMAVMMIKHNHFISNPFYTNENLPDNIKTVMVNAVGFGGNAVSVILKKS
jgi:3-oxoacyl-(acyl-carrier-protein) synthase